MKFLISAVDPEHPNEILSSHRVCVVESKSMKDLLMDLYIPFIEVRHRTEFDEQILEAVVWVDKSKPDFGFLIEELPKEVHLRELHTIATEFKNKEL